MVLHKANGTTKSLQIDKMSATSAANMHLAYPTYVISVVL